MRDAPWGAFFAAQAFLFVGAVVLVIGVIGGVIWLALYGLWSLFNA